MLVCCLVNFIEGRMENMQAKYIFMTGGVCSGLGKGITAASLGRLLKSRGYKVTIQKFDPYINMHPGLLSPYQHGEVYVTEDGAEVDLDLGHYERFIDENLSINNSVSAGKIYWEVLNNERKGVYKGATIQIIPHITNAIKEYIYRASNNAQSDIIISEIGGTVGDIESLPFLEAIRQTMQDKGYDNVMYIHVTLVPYLSFADEMKTKPSQHSVKELLSLGIKPDVLVCRTEHQLTDDMKVKLASFCNVKEANVIENRSIECLYEVPLMLEKEGFADIVCERLKIESSPPDLVEWNNLVIHSKHITKEIEIGLVGKYTEYHDAYLSVVESISHAGITQDVRVNLRWIHAQDITTENINELLQGLSGILMPSGYGTRGVDGLIIAVKYAREYKIPFLGIGLGMHCAIIEFARNVLNWEDADSIEINNETSTPVIERINMHLADDSDPMRRGALPCKLNPQSLLFNIYGENLIYERFRHLCKMNNQYRKDFIAQGLIESALSPDEQCVEAIELPTNLHPWFVGVQFNPEFKSRITKPSPLFKSFIGACL